MEMLSNGILDIEETEGEEISLTAEGPQFTEEERLRIESEKEDGDDKEEKRIDLFASEDGEADPLNKLLMAEDGISTLFMKKGGRVPFQGGGRDASSDDFGGGSSDKGETSSDSGFGGGETTSSSNNNNNNDNNAPDTQGHSRFDPGSGYYGEPVTNKGEKGDTTTNNPDVFYDDEIGRKTPIERIKTNVVDRRTKYNKAKNIHAVKQIKNVFTGNIVSTVYDQYKFQKNVVDPYVNDLKADIERYKDLGVPEYSPHTDTLIQELEQEILDITQPKSRDDDKKDDGGSEPVIEEIIASTETIQDRDETDIFDLWDRIKSNQAKRAMLKESGIIQDNTQEETIMLNSGGLANLFRVKTQ